MRRLDEPFHRLRICVPLNTSDIIAFVATTNPERARIFYENVLGLALLADEPAALVFDANGVMLRVAKVLRHPRPRPKPKPPLLERSETATIY